MFFCLVFLSNIEVREGQDGGVCIGRGSVLGGRGFLVGLINSRRADLRFIVSYCDFRTWHYFKLTVTHC